MKIKFMSWIFTALMMFCGAAAVFGQTSDPFRDWANVKALSAGQRVIIKTKNGAVAKGLINQVTGDSITVIGKKQNVTLARNEVARINTSRKL